MGNIAGVGFVLMGIGVLLCFANSGGFVKFMKLRSLERHGVEGRRRPIFRNGSAVDIASTTTSVSRERRRRTHRPSSSKSGRSREGRRARSFRWCTTAESRSGPRLAVSRKSTLPKSEAWWCSSGHLDWRSSPWVPCSRSSSTESRHRERDRRGALVLSYFGRNPGGFCDLFLCFLLDVGERPESLDDPVEAQACCAVGWGRCGVPGGHRIRSHALNGFRASGEGCVDGRRGCLSAWADRRFPGRQ